MTATTLALIDRPEDRVEAIRWHEIVTRIDGAAVKLSEIERIVAEGIASRGTVIRRYYAWRKEGAAALVDKRRLRKPGERSQWLQAYLRYTEDDQRTSLGGWRRMMADLRAGVVIEGIGDWQAVWAAEHPRRAIPECCPAGWVPAGAAYSTLQRAARNLPSRQFSLAINRQGMQAAKPYVLPVLRSRLGLAPGQIYEFDDKWHDVEVLFDGQTKPVRALEFAGYDVASAYKIACSIRPRITESDGRRDSLKEREFRWLLAHVLTDIGIHRDGCRIVLEHGTTAIREKHEQQIKSTPVVGALLTFERSGILSEQVHAGMCRGDGGGNFRMKALCEQSHRRDHDSMAYLPGQVGLSPARRPESHAALVRYHEMLMKAAAKLPERTRALLDIGMLTWEQYTSAYHTIQARLADDHEHALEGWDPETRTVVEWRMSDTSGEWHSVDDLLQMDEDQRQAVSAFLSAHPACKRARPMSRREAWSTGQDDLIRAPLQEMPMLLTPADARPAHVGRDGLIRFRDKYLGRDDQLYHAQIESRRGYQQALPPGKELLMYYTPFHTGHIWLIDPADGRMLGMAPRFDRAPRYDQAAILAAAGRQNADLARKILPIRGRHQTAAEQRARMMGHNADVLAGRVTPDSPATHTPPPADAEDGVAAALAEIGDAF